jgi:hypothetical protein
VETHHAVDTAEVLPKVETHHAVDTAEVLPKVAVHDLVVEVISIETAPEVNLVGIVVNDATHLAPNVKVATDHDDLKKETTAVDIAETHHGINQGKAGDLGVFQLHETHVKLIRPPIVRKVVSLVR